MATPRKWSNVAVAMQSALAAATTITAITKAAPGVVTSTAHGYSNGDYILLTAQGMHQVNGRVFRVANQTANTYELEGETTTSYDTFSSGSAEKITFGTSITTFTGLSASGGDLEFIDTTTIHGNVRTQIPGTTSPVVYNFDSIWDVSDAGLTAMKSAYSASAQRCFRFTFGTGGQIMVFAGYIGASLVPVGNAQEMVTTPAAITMYGSPTYYSS